MFRDPDSVAVVGASANTAKWGYWLAAGALRDEHRRRVDLVNHRSSVVLGRSCAPRLAELDEIPELVAVCVPAGQVGEVVDEGLALGAKGFLGITAGVDQEPELTARIRASGARLLGANSLGIYDSGTGLQLAWGNFTPGPMAIVSQSGQVGSELSILGARSGLGISRFVSVGNQSDVSATEVIADLAEHEQTKVIALYLESFTDGPVLFETLAKLREVNKPTVVLTIGSGPASSRLAQSHTGSLTSRVDVVDAACRAAGVLRVGSPGELIDVARTYLAAPPRSAGRRVAVIGDSGGQCGIAADQAVETGLSVPAFSPSTRDTFAARIPSGASTSNPVDLAGAGEQDLANYAHVAAAALRSSEVDSVVMTGYFGCYAEDVPDLAHREREIAEDLGGIAREHDKPLLVHSMAGSGPTLDALWHSGVPTFTDIRATLRCLRALDTPSPRYHLKPESPPVAPRHWGQGYWSVREALSRYGVPFPPGAVVRDRAQLLETASTLRAPLVLKAGWLTHKSEASGIALGLSGIEALEHAFADMQERLGEGEYVLEELDTRSDVVEVLIGVRHDPGFGPVMTVGSGGVEAELHSDIAVDLAPLTVDAAYSMLDRLRCRPLLDGWRGRQSVDVAGLVDLIVAVSRLATAVPHVSDLELNPVRVAPGGVLAVDALAMTEQSVEQETHA